MSHFSRVVGMAVVTVVIAGCGGRGDRPVLTSVTGTVLFDSKPLPNACVVFMPEAGIVATGQTDATGQFNLMSNGYAGAAAGNYKVTITAGDGGGGDVSFESMNAKDRAQAAKSSIPAKYGDPMLSELTAVVKPGAKNELQFDLKK